MLSNNWAAVRSNLSLHWTRDEHQFTFSNVTHAAPMRRRLLEVAMKTLSKSISLLILVSWTPSVAQATELLLSRPANTNDLAQGLRSDQDFGTPEYPLQRIADRFSLESPSVVTAINWSGFYYPGGASPLPEQV